MTKKVTPISFVPRFFGAFGQFFKFLSSSDYAGRCQLVGHKEKFAFEVPEKIVKEVVIETVTEIKEVVTPRLETVSVDGAYQLLQLMQQEARFIDFIQEDISAYSDAEVGAASRVIHQGCAKVMKTNFDIETVSKQDENTRIEIPTGYNNKEFKLEGRIEGEGPFKGTLIHPGWKVVNQHLPKVSNTLDMNILAPAEVEV
jgi:hypothetical protein